MKLYYLCRKEDVSGTSGTGHVAEVAEFDDGTVVVRWTRDRNAVRIASTTVFNCMDDLLKVHGHEGKTDVELVVDSDQVADLTGAVETLRDRLRATIDLLNERGVPVPPELVNAARAPAVVKE
jgi:hypothetical protein